MKNTLNKLLWNEKGQALPIALAMLAIGSLVITPLLNLTETALRSGISEEGRMYEHYAANAGTSDGLLKIVTDNPNIPPVGENWSYSIADTNGRTVEVIISTIDQSNMKITSTATSNDGHNTEINCYLNAQSFPPNAITSTSITIGQNAVINGDIQWDSTLGTLTSRGTVNGNIIDAPIDWPSMEEVEAHYNNLIQGAPVYSGDLFIDIGPETISDPYSLGPIYVDGALYISAPSGGAISLDGLVYAKNRIAISSPNVDIYLNNNTFFSNGLDGLGFSSTTNDVYYGNGSIVARNQIVFSSDTDPESHLIVWSLKGWIVLNSPYEVTCGLYCGEFDTPGQITTGRNTVLTYSMPPANMSFPPLPSGSDLIFRIVGWESTSQ